MKARDAVLSVGTFLSALAVVSVLFIDFLPSFAGSYADQRFVLVFLTGVVTIGALFLMGSRALILSSLVTTMLPSLILALSFPILTLPFAHQPYVWVEPGMYAFYFVAMTAGAASLVLTGATHQFMRITILLVAGACFLYGAMSVTVYLFALQDSFFDLDDLIPWGFVNIRYWSHIATWFMPLLPLAVLVGPFGKFRLWRALVTGGAGLWWWIILLSTSRGTVLGLLFSTLLVVLLFGRYSLPWLKLFIYYLVVGVVIWAIFSLLLPSLLAGEAELRSLSTDSSGRMPLFIEAWQMSLKEFPFGMGPQSWITHELLTEEYVAGAKFAHPHNMYLMWAAEYGWLLIAIMGGLTLQLVYRFWKSRVNLIQQNNSEGIVLLIGFTASVAAALFHAGVSAVFMAPGSMLVGIVVLIGFCALVTPGRVILTDGSSGIRRLHLQRSVAGLLALTVTISWFFWLGQVVEYYKDMRDDEIFYQEEVTAPTLPRFWFHGNFPRRDTLSSHGG